LQSEIKKDQVTARKLVVADLYTDAFGKDVARQALLLRPIFNRIFRVSLFLSV
jgi:hypothetical protein